MAPGDPYITDAELKVSLGITDSSEDALITRANKGAARAIENRCGRRSFWLTPLTTRVVPTTGRVRPYRRQGYCLLLVPDIGSLDGFEVTGYSGAALDDPGAIERDREPVTGIRLPLSYYTSDIEITARWGWPEVPADIEWANQMQAQRYYGRRGSPEGIAGSTEWGLVSVPRLDPDVRGIVDSYRRPGIG